MFLQLKIEYVNHCPAEKRWKICSSWFELALNGSKIPKRIKVKMTWMNSSTNLKITFGSPPVPSAISRANEPVDTTGTWLEQADRPSHMIEPLPKDEEIWSMACWRAICFFDIFSSNDPLPSDFNFLLPPNPKYKILDSNIKLSIKFSLLHHEITALFSI